MMQTSRPWPLRRPVSERERFGDFVIGFAGWWLVNLPLWLILSSQTSFYVGNIVWLVCGGNLVIAFLLLFVRRIIAYGILTTYAVNFLFALGADLLNNGLCWVPFLFKW